MSTSWNPQSTGQFISDFRSSAPYGEVLIAACTEQGKSIQKIAQAAGVAPGYASAVLTDFQSDQREQLNAQSGQHFSTFYEASAHVEQDPVARMTDQAINEAANKAKHG